jgi:hypothetical protein
MGSPRRQDRDHLGCDRAGPARHVSPPDLPARTGRRGSIPRYIVEHTFADGLRIPATSRVQGLPVWLWIRVSPGTFRMPVQSVARGFESHLLHRVHKLLTCGFAERENNGVA